MKSTVLKGQKKEDFKYPVLAKSKADSTIVLFTNATVGMVLVVGEKYSPKIGEFSFDWCAVTDKTVWEILPTGSTVTLEQE